MAVILLLVKSPPGTLTRVGEVHNVFEVGKKLYGRQYFSSNFSKISELA